MTDYIELALQYGGFTLLDKVYLEKKLARFSDEDKLALITPPPSVINAYFAELYQKEGPEAACAYFFKMSQALNLFQENPSFAETKPFVRLNLSGKSYGFAYENDQEEAIVFAESKEEVSDQVLFELAQIFPHYGVYTVSEQIRMKKLDFAQELLEDLTPDSALLSTLSKTEEGMIKIASYNQQEAAELARAFDGERYYQFKQREFLIWIDTP